jgi:signal transduction histidine kinase
MTARLISKFGGEFVSTVQEQAYLAVTWPQTALHLRIAITVSMLGLLSSFYLYYLLFGTGYRFQVLCLSVIAVILNLVVLFVLTYRDSYTMPARLLSMFALILLSVNQLLGHHFLLIENQVHNKIGMPFIIVIILIFYAFVPNRAYKTIMATAFASLIFLFYYIFSPFIPFQSIFMFFIELLAVNAMGYLFLINWNRLRRLEFAHRKELEDEVSKRIEAEKVARAASAAKTRFLASASHDLRQPLQAQRLYVETMVAQTKEKPVRELGGKVVSSQGITVTVY